MFNVSSGGVIEPIKWGKDKLKPNCSILVLDESTNLIYLWYGSKQGLVACRTALRQAQSLKGHGYTVGDMIIGRETKHIREINQKKVGRDSKTDELNEEFQEILNREYKAIDDCIITFELSAEKEEILKSKPNVKAAPKSKIKPEIKAEIKPEIMSPPEKKIKPEIEPKKEQKVLKPIKKVIVKEKESLPELGLLTDLISSLNKHGGLDNILKRFEQIEKNVELLLNGFKELANNMGDNTIPIFLKNLKQIKTAIKNGKPLPDIIQYPPSRDEYIKKEAEKSKKL